jgi:gamma-glutamylcyclotransferase (GGCT)/AIG2-like uncharacterized protein YtfP
VTPTPDSHLPDARLPDIHLFVYGTLRPHDVRWPMLEPFVIDLGWNDTVHGRLFDTGLGYPAAIFAPPPLDLEPVRLDRTVRGRTVRLVASAADRALELLDIEEDTVEGLYRRVSVVTASGVRAWAYEYGAGLDLTPIDSGDWFERNPT